MSVKTRDVLAISELGSLHIEWLWVYDGHVPVTETWSKFILVPAGVFFVLKGRCRLQCDEKVIEAPTGSVFLAAPGLRRQWFADGTRLLSVAFRATWPDGRPLHVEGLNVVPGVRQSRRMKEATRRLFIAVHGGKSEVTFAEASQKQPMSVIDWCVREAAFREWFVAYVKTLDALGIKARARRTASDARLGEILRRLDSWPLERVLDATAIADGLSLGVRRLEQLLVLGTGHTPHGYLNLRRQEAARRRLLEDDGPLKELAYSLGFRHASHFTAWFKRHNGVAPGAYRAGSTQGAV